MREALAIEAWLGFQIQGTGSNRLSIFLSILFPEPPNSKWWGIVRGNGVLREHFLGIKVQH